MSLKQHPTGRRTPSDWNHVEKHPMYAEDLPKKIPAKGVEAFLELPPYKAKYDQKTEGSCTGFGSSWAMSMFHYGNHHFPFFDAEWLYHEAQLIDEFADTPPAEGSSVRAAFDVLRKQGHRLVLRGHEDEPNLVYGVTANTWATSVDDIRAAIFNRKPVTLGINWYSNFDQPVEHNGKKWIGLGDLGHIRGGHCLTAYAASDSLEGVRLVNNWGRMWPTTWLPYRVLERLLGEDGEATLISDVKITVEQ